MSDDLELKFGATIDGVLGGISTMTEAVEGLGATVQGLTSPFTQFAEAAAAAFAVERIDKFIDAQTNLGVEIERTAQQLGIGTEQVGVFNVAAMESDTSLANMRNGMARFDLNLQEATKGTTTAAAAFKQLGIEVLDAHGKLKPANDLLMEVSEAFSRTADDGNKTAMAMALFGRSGKDLIPILDQGKAGFEELRGIAERTGTLFRERLVEDMNATHRKIVELDLAEQGLGNSIFELIKPAYDAWKQSEIGVVEEMNRTVTQINSLITTYGLWEGVLKEGEQIGEFVAMNFKRIFIEMAAEVDVAVVKMKGSWDKLKAWMTLSLSNEKTAEINQHVADQVKEIWGDAALAVQNDWIKVGTELGRIQGQVKNYGEQFGPNKPKQSVGGMGLGVDKESMQDDLEAYKQDLADMLQAKQAFGQQASAIEVQFWQKALGENEEGSKEYIAIENEMNQAYKAGMEEQLNATGESINQKKSLWAQYFAWLRTNYATDFKDQNAAYIKIEQLNQQAVQKDTQAWTQFFGTFNSGLNDMILHKGTWANAIQSIDMRVLNFGENIVEKMVAKWLAGEVAKQGSSSITAKIMQALGLQEETQSAATTAVMNKTKIMGDAAVADAGTVAFLAPMMGPAAVAEGAAVGADVSALGIASYEVGTPYVPQTGLAMLHQGEAVIPADLNKGLGGSTQVTFHVSAMDSQSVAQFFQTHGSAIAKQVVDQAKRGNPAFRGRS